MVSVFYDNCGLSRLFPGNYYSRIFTGLLRCPLWHQTSSRALMEGKMMLNSFKKCPVNI